MKRIATLSALFLLSYVVLCAVACFFVSDNALHPSRRPLDADELSYALQVARQAGSELQNVSLTASDQADLQAWLTQPATANGSAVIVLHGMGDNRGGVIGYAQQIGRAHV